MIEKKIIDAGFKFYRDREQTTYTTRIFNKGWLSLGLNFKDGNLISYKASVSVHSSYDVNLVKLIALDTAIQNIFNGS